MWQVFLGALILISASASRHRPAPPIMAFAALKKTRSYLPRCLALSAVVHFVLLFVFAFVLELVRDSNRQLRASQWIPSGASIQLNFAQKNYYPAQPLPGHKQNLTGISGHRNSTLPSAVLNGTPGPVLIEPDTPVQNDLQLAMPAFLHWLRSTAPQAITPGATQAARTSLPEADPGPQAPNDEKAAGSISLAWAPGNPNVQVAPSTTVPLRLAQDPESSHDWIRGGEEGMPLAAMSIASRLPAPNEVVALPRAALGGSVAAGVFVSSEPGGENAASAAPGQLATALFPSSAVAASNPTEPAIRVAETRAGSLEVREFKDGSREIRYPKDGRFDLVLIQTAGGDLVPETAPFLTGRPVYTVYIALGAAREWILQYCAPRSVESAPVQSGMVVSLGSHATVQPPWIRSAALPPPSRARLAKRSVFYGKLQANGRLANMHMLSGAQYEARPELLSYLDAWEFRPAERGGLPAEIDVVLIVPADAAL